PRLGGPPPPNGPPRLPPGPWLRPGRRPPRREPPRISLKIHTAQGRPHPQRRPRHPRGGSSLPPGPEKVAAMPARPGDPAKTTARAAGRAAASRPASASPRASAPRGWRQYWQIVPLAGVLWALDAVDKFRAGAQAAGLLHAPVINDLSGRLSGSVAVVMNQWTSTHPQAAAPATAWYIVLHVLVTGTVGVLLLRSGHRSFGLHRNALIVAGVVGLVVFWAYPVAPPRMLPGYHDAAATAVPIFHSLLETKAADQFASFPSLHVTWALWVAVATQSLARRRRWQAAVWAYPMLATVDVLATANHYLLDVVTAPAALALAYATAAAQPPPPPPA